MRSSTGADPVGSIILITAFLRSSAFYDLSLATNTWPAEGDLRLGETRVQEGIMTKTKLTLIAASVAVAIGLFGAKILIAPPTSQAAIMSNIPVEQLTLNAPKDLPHFEDKYQRHLGVLDTLKSP